MVNNWYSSQTLTPEFVLFNAFSMIKRYYVS